MLVNGIRKGSAIDDNAFKRGVAVEGTEECVVIIYIARERAVVNFDYAVA